MSAQPHSAELLGVMCPQLCLPMATLRARLQNGSLHLWWHALSFIALLFIFITLMMAVIPEQCYKQLAATSLAGWLLQATL